MFVLCELSILLPTQCRLGICLCVIFRGFDCISGELREIVEARGTTA